MSWTSGQISRLLPLLILPFAIGVIGLVLLKQILLPFMVGLAAAYILDPLADRLERVKFSRTAATGTITVGFFLILTIVILLLLPPLASQAASLAADLPGYVDQLRSKLVPMLRSAIELPVLANVMERFDLGGDWSADGLIRERAGEAVGIFLRSATQLLKSSVALLNLVALIFVTPIVTFYMLRDWDRMVATLRGLVPPSQRATFDQLGTEIDEVLAGFLRGQGLVCTFLAVFYAFGLWAIGLNYGLIIGLLTGFFSFIPFIGMAVGMAIGLSVAAFQFQGRCSVEEVCTPPDACTMMEVCQYQELWMILVVAGIFGLGQFIEGNLISPRLVGSRIHLHPVWMIFAVLAGTTLFGILGTLLAVPTAAVLGVLIRFGLKSYQASPLFDAMPAAAGEATMDQAPSPTTTDDDRHD